MLKDNVRDYATAAFREYARLGCPAPEAISRERDAALAADLRAVAECLHLLCVEEQSYIGDALRAVYFVAPDVPLRKGDVGKRVAAFAREYPASEASVYRWLARARWLFCRLRGIRTM